MGLIHAIIAGLRRLFRGRTADAELANELRHYEAMAAEEYRLAGLSDAEAARAARVEVGSVASVRDRVRSAGWEARLESIWRDVVHSARALRRSPSYTLTALVVLSLGMGVNTAIFSVVNAVILRPLPVSAPHELGFVYSAKTAKSPVSYQDFRAIAAHRDAFSAATAVRSDAARLRSGDDDEDVVGEEVAGTYFTTLGRTAILGRTLTEGDDDPAADPVVVISASLWRRRFSASPDVIGQAIRLDFPAGVTIRPGRRYTIVGVIDESFPGVASPWTSTEYWVPLTPRGLEREAVDVAEGFPPRPGLPGSLPVGFVIVRLLPGQSVAAASALVGAVRSDTPSPAMRAEDPSPRLVWSARRRVQLPFDPSGKIAAGAVASALMAVGIAVVLIAAANLGALASARGVARRKEIAVRLMIGAGRWQVARQLAVESLMLAVMGGVGGLLVANMLVALFVGALPAQFGAGSFTAARAVSLDVGLDPRVALFVTVIGVAVGVFASVGPVREVLRTTLGGGMSVAGTGTSAPRSSSRQAMVMVQMSVALMLLLLAGVSLRALFRSVLPDPGYAPERAVAVSFAFDPPSREMTGTERAAFFERRDQHQRRVLDLARAVPNVKAAALTLGLPMFSNLTTWVVSRDGFAQGASSVKVAQAIVSPDYFSVLGIRLVQGRVFTAADAATTPKVAVIGEDTAKRWWPNQNAVGRYIGVAFPGRTTVPEWLEVVGVVSEVRAPLSEEDPSPWVYTALLQQPHPYGINLVASTDGSASKAIEQLRRAVIAADPTARVVSGSALASKVEEVRYPLTMAAGTLTLASALSVALACLGLYGVMSYSVSQRMRELGIRTALGASRGNVIGLVVREGARIATVGAVVGLGLGLAAIRVTSTRVVGLPHPDAIVLVAVPLVLAVAVLLACYLPARRAVRVDPLSVLRDS